jgi:cytoskeletal protein RodZ
MEEAGFQNPVPAFTVPSKKSPKRFYILVIVVIVLIVFFVIYSRVSSSNSETSEITPTPTVEITSTPTPTPEETPTPKEEEEITPTPKPTKNPIDKSTGLDRSELTIEVQNGSGMEGAAGKVSDFLKEYGYQISSTGNADNYEYSGVTVIVKSGSSDYLGLLKADLQTKYSVTSTSNDLSASVSADALVIIGK